MTSKYLPAGYSDSDSDSNSDLYVETQKTKCETSSSWLLQSISKVNQEEDFDVDIKQVLDEGDVGLLSDLITSAGVDVNHKLASSNGWSLALYCASKAEHQLLSWLVNQGGKLNSSGGQFSGYLVLSLIDPTTVSEEKILQTAKVIQSTGETVDKQQEQGKTALMLAASYGNIVLARFLCEAAANLDLRDSQGWSALMFAADGGHGESVRYLLDTGANPDFVSAEGQTAADIASMQSSAIIQHVIEQFSKEKGLQWKEEGPRGSEIPSSDMDNILLGLDLEEYQEVFRAHKIGVEEFLLVSEADLIEMGVDRVGARRRMLEAQYETHKKKWERSAMPRLKLADTHAGLRLTCPETAEVLGNLSIHVSFLKASVAYLRLQVREHGPRLMQVGSDLVTPSQLIQSIETCRSKALDLEKECKYLYTELELQGYNHAGLPADSVARKVRPSGRKLMIGSLFSLVVALAAKCIYSYAM